MSVLNNILLEEYQRIDRVIDVISEEIDSLHKGYISKKTIGGKVYAYLQWREAGRVKSFYIKKDLIVDYEALIERRRSLEKQRRELVAEKKKLEKVI